MKTYVKQLILIALVIKFQKSSVNKFIYASVTVYGFSDSENVTEEHHLVPLTLYNKFEN